MKGLIFFFSIGIAWMFGSSMFWLAASFTTNPELSKIGLAFFVFSFFIFPLGIIWRDDDIAIKRQNYTGVKQ